MRWPATQSRGTSVEDISKLLTSPRLRGKSTATTNGRQSKHLTGTTSAEKTALHAPSERLLNEVIDKSLFDLALEAYRRVCSNSPVVVAACCSFTGSEESSSRCSAAAAFPEAV